MKLSWLENIIEMVDICHEIPSYQSLEGSKAQEIVQIAEVGYCAHPPLSTFNASLCASSAPNT